MKVKTPANFYFDMVGIELLTDEPTEKPTRINPGSKKTDLCFMIVDSPRHGHPECILLSICHMNFSDSVFMVN